MNWRFWVYYILYTVLFLVALSPTNLNLHIISHVVWRSWKTWESASHWPFQPFTQRPWQLANCTVMWYLISLSRHVSGMWTGMFLICLAKSKVSWKNANISKHSISWKIKHTQRLTSISTTPRKTIKQMFRKGPHILEIMRLIFWNLKNIPCTSIGNHHEQGLLFV